MAQVYTQAGNKLAISTTTQSADLDEVGFSGLVYTEIANVGSVGEFGINTNILTYDMLDTVVAGKAKGITNAGDPVIEVARVDDDAGQQALRTAGAPNYYEPHAFRYTRQDGSVEYLRGLVTGPNQPNGRNEDFDLLLFTLALVQAPLHVEASV